ncbi:MAG: Rhs element Vgr protein, partial [Chitinophagaceae bacterium]|nr:Rhs element Vgr protein [Chitinophagaceae bacterium]
VGDRFNGDVYVSGVEHHLTDGMWTTVTELGLPADWPSTGNEDISAPQAAGLLPAIQGIHNAVVLQIAQDPDNDYRILVKIPLISDTGIWARLSNFSATSGAGSFFYPEVGDEVLVGFMNNDPRYPVIMGSVYSQKNKPPYTPDDKNTKKGFITKAGLKLEFDDENKITTVTTPANNSFVLNDKDKTVTVSDMNGNKLVMSASDISISSPKNINISANQQVNIKGNMGVTLQATAGDVKISGMNVKTHADMEASIEGSATASLTGGAQATIKGAMVMIN